MDIKTLSTIIGHVSSSTTLNIYAHVTDEMRRTAAAKIDLGIAGVDPQKQAQAAPRKPPPSTFQPRKGKRRKPDSGCISQITENLWEGRYSPIWPDGTRHAKNVYAKTRKECERKLKALIQEMQAEQQALRDQMRGVTPPSKLTKTQKKIWMYMKFHPDVTSYQAIARGAGVTRHTVAKWYEMIREMLGRAV